MVVWVHDLQEPRDIFPRLEDAHHGKELSELALAQYPIRVRVELFEKEDELLQVLLVRRQLEVKYDLRRNIWMRREPFEIPRKEAWSRALPGGQPAPPE